MLHRNKYYHGVNNFERRNKWGFFCRQVAQSELDLDLVKTILGEYKIHNADVTLREDVTAEDLIDVVEGNRVYIPCLYLLNKIDQISIEVQKKSQIGKS